jgi:hypothetical protein
LIAVAVDVPSIYLLRCPPAGQGKKRNMYDWSRLEDSHAIGKKNASNKIREPMTESQFIDFHLARPFPYTLIRSAAVLKWRRDIRDKNVDTDSVHAMDEQGFANGPLVQRIWVEVAEQKVDSVYEDRKIQHSKDIASKNPTAATIADMDQKLTEIATEILDEPSWTSRLSSSGSGGAAARPNGQAAGKAAAKSRLVKKENPAVVASKGRTDSLKFFNVSVEKMKAAVVIGNKALDEAVCVWGSWVRHMCHECVCCRCC